MGDRCAEFKYGDDKKAYLSADLYDRSIVSYVLSHRNYNALVFRTLDLAIAHNRIMIELISIHKELLK